MFDTIKKTLLAGLGAAVLTKEKVDDVLEDFVKQGRISATDARKLADRLARQGRREFVNAATETGGRIKQVISRADRETQARIDRLVARVQRLEKRKSSGKAKPRRRRSARR